MAFACAQQLADGASGEWGKARSFQLATTMRIGLERSQIRVEVGHGFDAAEIVFKSQVFVGGVGVFVRQAKADQDARHFEGVVHLRYERNGTTLANENSLSAETL